MNSQYKKNTVDELKKICKNKGINGYSKLTKQKLIDLLLQHDDLKPRFINTKNTEQSYLIELQSTIKKDKKRLVCKLCHELGHDEKSIYCNENTKINKKIKKYIMENQHYEIKELACKFNKTQKYITEYIKTISKLELIENKNISDNFIDEILDKKLIKCEICNINKCHSQNNRVWKNKNVCDICWCSFEGEREKIWEEINNITNKYCKICKTKRINTKMRFHYDHKNMFIKNNSIFSMINDGCDIEEIKKEVYKCNFVCISCHSIITELEQKLGFTIYKGQLVKKLNNDEINIDDYEKEINKLSIVYENKMKNIYEILSKKLL